MCADAGCAYAYPAYKSVHFCEPLSRYKTTSLPTFPFLLTVEKKESLCLNIVVITSRGEHGFSR
ncbi:hypothetical protein CRG95_06250 [Escherichia sp. E4208]|nr:hypothetical protein D9740_17945 [Escherichia sp. E14V5]RZN00501.1 hypothetical protein D9741_21035 [Escherichia sp. E14V7]RZN27096.1 hypothetical protein D9739_11205 [Escherichia sp. E14V10]TGB71811.1 hypothetical protein CRI67_22610 [Escherichia sp. E4702]TGB86576.1 hypothetical protein CRG95_06250 [Escherichia sp. E4208]